jgi:hypothetical protein
MDRFILLIGIAVILGSIGGRLFAHLRIPQVVGYIITGILAILASHRFHDETAQSIILVITAITFLVQIIGPPSVRLAVIRAGEVGRMSLRRIFWLPNRSGKSWIHNHRY